MRAVFFEQFGGIEVLQTGDVPRPVPAADQVLVEVHAAGVNPVDWKIREGWLDAAFPCEFPVVPGWDMAGTVFATGSDVTAVQTGDRVYCYNRMELVRHGTWAEYAPAVADTLALIPGNLDFASAAAVPLVALTAWQCLVEFAGISNGEKVFINAGAGGVGSFAIQIARHFGASVIATASPHNHDYLRELGCDHALDYRDGDIAGLVKKIAPRGVEIVLDCSGREDVAANFDLVRSGTGRVVTINGLQHTVPVLEEMAARHRVRAKLVVARPEGRQLGEISGLLEKNRIKPVPVEVFPLDQAAAAMEKSRVGHVRGKLVLRIR